MVPSSAETAPYLGSRPFERTEADRRRFFGRGPELEELAALVLSHNLVLVYAASGAGKSSLLDAGVVPELVGEGFEVLPRGRVGVACPADVTLDERTNPYVLNLLCSLSPEDDPASLLQCSIAERLRALPPPESATGRVIVIDQAEELFTFTPKDWLVHQKEFFLALRDALRDAPDLRIVIVTREDYLARFDDFAPLLPGGLRARFHLEPLGREAARQAVERPLEGTHRRFEAGVAAQLVEDLSRMKIATGIGGIREEPGPYVEPVQLQIVCSALWNKLPARVEVITADHLHRFGSVEETLEGFYRDTIEACIQETDHDKERLTRWFGDKLITPSDTRGQVFRGPTETEGLPNKVVEFLEARHLLRADPRASGRWYELAHDRLIRPIRSTNERWASAFTAARVRREKRRAMLRAGLVVLGVALLLGGIGAAISASRLKAQLRENALTVDRVEELRANCSKRTPDCAQKTVRVFDFIADYYWRQGKIGELAELLKGAADLIPSDYGMPAPESTGIDNSVDANALRIEYNPDWAVDKWRMRSEWALVARKLGEQWGLPVSPNIALVKDQRLPLRSVRVTASPKTCAAPSKPVQASTSVAMPARGGAALISLAEITKENRLGEFFDRYSSTDGWQPSQELTFGGPWWFVPSWTLPIWRIGGQPAVSREAVLAVVVANDLVKRPDLVLGCDALHAILRKARKESADTVNEAISAHTMEGLRLAFIEIVRSRGRSLTNPSMLLDALANHPGVDAATAAELADKEQTARGDAHGVLHGPWKKQGPSPQEQGQPTELDKQIAGRTDCREHPILIDLGPDIRSAIVDEKGMWHEDARLRLRNLRGALYRRYGVVGPGVQLRKWDEGNGLKITVLNQHTRDPDAQAIEVSPAGAADRLFRELDVRYRSFRAWWMTADEIGWAIRGLLPDERAWIGRRYSLTDLKRLARAVVVSDDDQGDADTLRDLLWLLRSLPFWVHAFDPKNLVQLAGALRSMQRARRQPTDPMSLELDGRVTELVRRGLAALDVGRANDAEAFFAAAITADRDAATTVFLAEYPALSLLGPTRRSQTLSIACHLSSPGDPFIERGMSMEYEIQDLLANTREPPPPDERRRLELCLVGYIAAQKEHPREVQHRVSALLRDEPVDAWTEEEALFLAHHWLLANHQVMIPPAEIGRVEQLLTRGFMHLTAEAAMSAWRTLRDNLGNTSWRWPRNLVATLAGTLPLAWRGVKLDMALWLTTFGEVENEQALALVDKIAAGTTAGDRWQWAWTRASSLAHLGDYGDPPQRANRLDAAAVALRSLSQTARTPTEGAHALSSLANVHVKRGDVVSARRAIHDGIQHLPGTLLFHEQLFWIEIGDGAVDRAGEIAADKQRRAPDEISTLFINAAFATLTRRADFEATARAFIFHEDKGPQPKDPNRYVDYVRFLLFWALSETKQAQEARQLIDDRMREIDRYTWGVRLQQRDSTVWREMLVAFFAGRIPESAIFDPLRDDASFAASALQHTELTLSALRCEAYFYAALRESVTGDIATRKQRLRDKLQLVLASKHYGFIEYRMARFLLGRSGG